MSDETMMRVSMGPWEVEVSGASKEETEEMFDHAWDQVTEHLEEAMSEVSDAMSEMDVPNTGSGVDLGDGPMDGFR